MLLYGLPYSAYCAKVRIALRLKHLEFDEVVPPDGYRSEAYRAIAPAGTIPALDIGGRILFESDAIIEYLNEIAPDPPLLPKEPVARAAARAASRYHDGHVEPAVRTLFPLIGREPADRSAFDDASARLRDRLDRLCEAFDPAPFIAGELLSVGDLGYPGTLMMAERLLAVGRSELALPPALEAWRRRLMGISEVAQTVTEMEAALLDWIAGKKGNAT